MSLVKSAHGSFAWLVAALEDDTYGVGAPFSVYSSSPPRHPERSEGSRRNAFLLNDVDRKGVKIGA